MVAYTPRSSTDLSTMFQQELNYFDVALKCRNVEWSPNPVCCSENRRHLNFPSSPMYQAAMLLAAHLSEIFHAEGSSRHKRG